MFVPESQTTSLARPTTFEISKILKRNTVAITATQATEFSFSLVLEEQ
jgi:hypothetical protein